MFGRATHELRRPDAHAVHARETTERPSALGRAPYIEKMVAVARLASADVARVLVVDDDGDDAAEICACLESDGHSMDVVEGALAALDALDTGRFDIVVSAVRMRGTTGLELVDRLAKVRPLLPVILVTRGCTLAEAVAATKRGAYDYVARPLDVASLRAAVGRALLEQARRKSAPPPPSSSTSLRVEAFELIGAAAPMIALSDAIDRVALSSAPALVRGETGVGKELVARAIHARGPRRAAPFVAVNVAAIPSQLLESEIFGHVRGSFTGASVARRGVLLEADKGTLLLDEMGDMPLELQAKLLRVLQFGELRPVGADVPRRVDVRVIASTHRDLRALVDARMFREDLYYRLDVLPIHVPSLRERASDIPALVTHFLECARERAPSATVRALGAGALAALVRAPWPGNVRQLANVVERLVVFGREETVSEADVEALFGASAASLEPARSPSSDQPELLTLKQLGDAHVALVMRHTKGNKARAAQILGVNQATLYRWERKTN